MNFEEHKGFKKDVKELSKKRKSLVEDLCVLKKVLAIFPNQRPPFSFQVDHHFPAGKIIKIGKVACKSLKGKGAYSGLAVIYALVEMEKKIVLLGIYEREKQKYEKTILRRWIS